MPQSPVSFARPKVIPGLSYLEVKVTKDDKNPGSNKLVMKRKLAHNPAIDNYDGDKPAEIDAPDLPGY